MGNKEQAPLKKLISLKEILRGLIDKEATPNILTVNHLWLKAVNNQVAKRTKPIATKGSILLVYVSSSVWLNELMFSKKSIIDRLNILQKENFISDIKFKIGNI